MTEDFLCWLWQYQVFDKRSLYTRCGSEIQVYNAGIKELFSGPDFSRSRLRIDRQQWAGTIEIHVYSSSWNAHKHQNDAAYNNVILHVVYHMDKEIYRLNGEKVPCLELKDRIPQHAFQRYLSMMKEGSKWLPCQNLLSRVRQPVLAGWINRVGIERLELKLKILRQLKLSCKNGSEEVFCRLMIKSFGTGINSDPFAWLASCFDYSLFEKMEDRPFALEALLFGQAGLLKTEFTDFYPRMLKRLYKKLGASLLPELNGFVWKFAGARPLNFPGLRIAQLCSLLLKRRVLFLEVMDGKKSDLVKCLLDAEPHEYWKGHSHFDSSSAMVNKRLGKAMVNSLIINLVPVFYLFMAEEGGGFSYKEKAMAFLEDTAPEENALTRNFKLYGLQARNSLETQGLIQLKKMYCDAKKCLNCAIGYEILRKDDQTDIKLF